MPRIEQFKLDKQYNRSPIEDSGLSNGKETNYAQQKTTLGLKAVVSKLSSLPRSVIYASFAINFLGLGLPLTMLQIYDRIIPNQSHETLSILIFALFSVIIIEALLKILRSYTIGWAAIREGFVHNQNAVSRLLNAPMREVMKESSASWLDRLEAQAQLNKYEGGQSRLILLDLPFVAIYLSVVAAVAGSLVLVPVSMILLFASFVIWRRRSLGQQLAERNKHDRRRYDFITECFNSIYTLKSMAMERLMERRLERLQVTTATLTHKNILLSNEFQAISTLFANMILIAVITFGAMFVIEGTLSIGALVCSTLLTSRILQPVMRGIQVWMELETMQIARECASGLMSLSESPVKPASKPTKGAIKFDQVDLASNDNEHLLLNKVSLDIAPGEIIGIKGERSSGRTNLLRLISGELTPQKGLITIDGLPVDHHHAVSKVSYVSAQFDMFQGTIIENISMFRKDGALARGRIASQLIGLEEDVLRLPLGYNTPLGKNIEEALPAGMLQRISIARSLATGRHILLFDEANANVDMKSDRLLRDGLANLSGHMTIVLISNRPSLLAIADRQYELTDGQLLPLNNSQTMTDNQTAAKQAG